MSLEFMEGFDTFNTAQIGRRGYTNGLGLTVVSGASSYQPSIGALHVSGPSYSLLGYLNLPITARSEYYFGFDCRTNYLGTTNSSYFCEILDVNGTAICIFWNASNNVGSTFGTSSPGTFPNQVWANIQIHFIVSPTVGRLTVRVNGTQVLDLTGLNTGSTNIGYLQLNGGLQANSGQEVDFDNVWIFNTLGTHSNTWPTGMMVIKPVFPASDGTYTDWTTSAGSTHYNLVNENPASDDASYVVDTVHGHKDTYGVQSLTGVISHIHGVQVASVLKKEIGVPKLAALIAKSGATIITGSYIEARTSYQSKTMLLLDDPNTSTEWTEAGVNALEIGITINPTQYKPQTGISRTSITTGFVQGRGTFATPCVGGDPNITFTSTVTAGNTIFVAHSSTQATMGSDSVSDSQGNVYTLLGSCSSANNSVYLWSAPISSTGSVTVTASGSGCGFSELCGMEMIGTLGTPYTPYATGTSTSGVSVSLTIPSPYYQSLVILCGCGTGGDMTTVTTGTATLGNYNYQNAGGGTTFIGYQLVNSSSVTSSFNYTGGYTGISMFAVAIPN